MKLFGVCSKTSLMCFALLTIAAAGVGCTETIEIKGPAHPNEAEFRSRPAATAKFVLRRPRPTSSVSEASASREWSQFELGLSAAGLNMLDSGLLEQLMKSHGAASYKEIHERTGADVVIEPLGLETKYEVVVAPGGSDLACEVERLPVKLIAVETATMLGTIEIGRSACPDLARVEVSRSTGPLPYRANGEPIESEFIHFGDAKFFTRVIELPDSARDWKELGRQLGKVILKNSS